MGAMPLFFCFPGSPTAVTTPACLALPASSVPSVSLSWGDPGAMLPLLSSLSWAELGAALPPLSSNGAGSSASPAPRANLPEQVSDCGMQYKHACINPRLGRKFPALISGRI